MKTTLNLILVLSLLFITNSALSYNTDSLLIKEERTEFKKLFARYQNGEDNLYPEIKAFRENLKTEKGVAYGYMLNGYYYTNIDLDSCLANFKKAETIFSRIGDVQGLLAVSMSSSQMFVLQGENDKGLDILINLLENESVNEDTLNRAKVEYNIGATFYSVKNTLKSKKYYTKAYNSFKSLNLNRLALKSLSKLGGIERFNFNYNKADSIFNKVLIEYRLTNDEPGIADILMELANINVSLDKPEVALSMLNEAKDIYTRLKVNCELGYLDVEFGHAYLGLKNFNKAKYHYDRGLKILDDCGYTYYRNTILDKLILAEENLGNFKTAYVYQKEYIAQRDSLESIEKYNFLQETETKYQTEKKEKELLQKDLKIAESNTKIISEKRFQSMLWIGIIALLLIASIILYFSFKQKRLNEKLEEHNDFKNKIFTIVSHDLRSPLAQIQREETTENVKKASSSALFILDDLLAWSKPNFKNLKIEKKKVIVNEVLEEVFEEVDFIAKEKEINIINNSNEDLVLIADANYLKIILRNCITNAIKYSDNGSEITLNSNEKSISILNTVGSTINSGTGLGLKISNDLAQQMDAKLEYANNNGTFTANLKF